MSVIVIFTGLPGTGKTTLSRKVADALGMPLIAKDAIKEIMYDKIGWSDKAFSAKLAQASLEIIDYVTEQHLKNNISIVLESNFSPNLASARFEALREAYGCDVLQIVCRTETSALAQRYYARQSIDRHPGHIDSGTPESYIVDYNRRIDNDEDKPLDIKSKILIVDTTDFGAVDVDEIADWIRTRY